jgi:hypothetical protein
MKTLGDLVRHYGPAYMAKYADHLLPSHRRVLQDLAHCRTAVLGGHVYYCATCEQTHYQYHSCQNRHCPQCQQDQGQQWLQKQQEQLLPVPYFMVTFTLPELLRPVARQHQKVIYNLLFQTSSAALQELAWDPRYVGGQIGLVGVLHTWGRDLCYHPHVHYLVPAGGLSANREQWLSCRQNFLVPVKALSILFRAKFRDALQQTALFNQIPDEVWQQAWITHSQPIGKGEGALQYLAPYIFRVAISNRRILKIDNDQVTFRYRPSNTGRWQTMTLMVEEFLRRFLQHVLPKGFVKVRYYGLFSRRLSHWVSVVRLWLNTPEAHPDQLPLADIDSARVSSLSVVCRTCGHPMQWLYKLPPCSHSPP